MDVDMQNEKGAARAETAELYDQVLPEAELLVHDRAPVSC